MLYLVDNRFVIKSETAKADVNELRLKGEVVGYKDNNGTWLTIINSVVSGPANTESIKKFEAAIVPPFRLDFKILTKEIYPDQLSEELIRRFVRRGIDKPFANGNTALCHFAYYSPDMVQRLLIAGADPNAKNEKGYSPLMFATKGMVPGAASKLIGAGADLDAIFMVEEAFHPAHMEPRNLRYLESEKREGIALKHANTVDASDIAAASPPKMKI